MAISAYLAFEPADAEAARTVGAELARAGWSVIDAEAAPADGQRDAAISEASLLLLFAGAASREAETLRRAAAVALNNGRPVIVAQTGPIEGADWLDFALADAVRVDVRDGPQSEVLSRILEAARKAIGGGRVIAMLNIKGGVGKTVLAANLFAAAHLADKRAISFVDLDPQHNLTQYFLSPGERNRIRDRNHTIYGVLSARDGTLSPADFGAIAAPLNRAKSAKRAPTFELIPGDERLFEFTLDARPERDKAEAFSRFRALVAALRQRSDAVIIDANPCATFLTRLAITAADHIVAPVRPEKYSLTGLNMLEHVVREIRGRPLRPEEFSVLLNGVNDRARSAETGDPDALTRNEIAAAPFFSGSLLSEEIPYSAALRSAPSERIAANPINVTAMMRVGGRQAKEALAHAAAAILRRSAP